MLIFWGNDQVGKTKWPLVRSEVALGINMYVKDIYYKEKLL